LFGIEKMSFSEEFSNVYSLQGKIIAVEGNIGSGKSTLLAGLEEMKFLKVIQEDVDSWKNEGWLELFYSNLERFSGTFQLRTQLSHIQNGKKFESKKINIVERSPLSNRFIFGKMLMESKFLHPMEYELIDQVNRLTGWEPHIVIVLLCDPDVCYERIKKRGREGENIPSVEYLKSLHQKHLELEKELKETKPEIHFIMIDTTFKTPNEIQSEFIQILKQKTFVKEEHEVKLKDVMTTDDFYQKMDLFLNKKYQSYQQHELFL
jgi:deoxyadenosine/deoxycytidine kinase